MIKDMAEILHPVTISYKTTNVDFLVDHTHTIHSASKRSKPFYSRQMLSQDRPIFIDHFYVIVFPLLDFLVCFVLYFPCFVCAYVQTLFVHSPLGMNQNSSSSYTIDYQLFI